MVPSSSDHRRSTRSRVVLSSMTTSGRNSTSVSGSTRSRISSQLFGERHVAVGRHLAATHEPATGRHRQADVGERRVGAGPPGEPDAERLGRRVADHQDAHRPALASAPVACPSGTPATSGSSSRLSTSDTVSSGAVGSAGAAATARARYDRRGDGRRRPVESDRRRDGVASSTRAGHQRGDVVGPRPPVVVGDRDRDDDRRHGHGRGGEERTGEGRARPPVGAADRALDQHVRQRGDDHRRCQPESEQGRTAETGAGLVDDHVDRPVEQVHAVADAAQARRAAPTPSRLRSVPGTWRPAISSALADTDERQRAAVHQTTVGREHDRRHDQGAERQWCEPRRRRCLRVDVPVRTTASHAPTRISASRAGVAQ